MPPNKMIPIRKNPNWKEATVFRHPETKISVRVNKRVKGPPAFSFEVCTDLSTEGTSRYGRHIHYSDTSIAEIVALLLKQAEKYAAEHLPALQTNWNRRQVKPMPSFTAKYK